MRLIATYQDEAKGVQLSRYLSSQGIENELAVTTAENWDDENYGAPTYRIWVIAEENFPKASEITSRFNMNSQAAEFQLPGSAFLLNTLPNNEPTSSPKRSKPSICENWNRAPAGRITVNLLMCCCLLLIFTTLAAPQGPKNPNPALPLPPLYFSTLQKNLLFDYPHAYEIIDEIAAKAGVENLEADVPLPSNLEPLFEQYTHTPYWKGYYPTLVSYFKGAKAPQSENANAPMFEKIREGQWWRLFSPSVMHADIFHLLFNMIWLVILGRQMELRLGAIHYIIFLVITSLVTNVAQYLMSGSSFLGFSGVVCAMITFIWMRQYRAPWEGYLMQKTTFNFVLFFIFLISALQITSFYTEIVKGYALAPPIANTAHLAGLAIGLILGNLNFFSWKNI